MSEPLDGDVQPVSTPDDLPTREAAFHAFVDANLKRNYIGNFVHGMLGMTGFRLINAPTFMPAYLHLISGSNTIVGLGLALQQVGGIVSPLVAGAKMEHRPKIMPSAVVLGSLGRMAILGMALAGWFLSGNAQVATLLLFLFLFGVFMGAQRVAFTLLMSKVIPLRLRGRLQAWRNAVGGLIAAVLAYVSGKYLIETNVLGNGYSTTFVLAFLLTSAGLWFLQQQIREPAPPTIREPARMRDRMKDIPGLIAADPAYRWFLVVQMLATSARIATPFYILHVGVTMHLDGATLGLLSLAFLGADTVSNIVWGYLGDRSGFRVVLLLSIAGWIAATVALMTLATPVAVFFSFFGLGAAQAGYMMASQTMILEFGHRDDLPMRIGISATAEGVTATLGPLIGGAVADLMGYGVVFGASLGLLGAALLLLVVAVHDPRKARP
ncbi:MAG: MFS transporter [Caulobacteraceae bacterium]|nr:MAG: MFS transporter [Caulobacteraceae bacterium]